jgi:hypothetical protein
MALAAVGYWRWALAVSAPGGKLLWNKGRFTALAGALGIVLWLVATWRA